MLLILLPSVALGITFVRDSAKTLHIGLLNYWRLENVIAFVGSNNLTNNGSTPFNAGKVFNAADFGASNSTKWLSNTTDVGITGGVISISLWFNLTTEPGSGVDYSISQQFDGGTGVGYSMHYKDVSGTKKVSWVRHRQGVVNNTLEETVTLTTGIWYHLVLTYDDTNVEGWRNNVSKGTVASSGGGTGGTEGFRIGAETSADTQKINGLVDEEGMWNRKLSATEISDLYRGGTGNRAINHKIVGDGKSN